MAQTSSCSQCKRPVIPIDDELLAATGAALGAKRVLCPDCVEAYEATDETVSVVVSELDRPNA
jgi:hypothetical protein